MSDVYQVMAATWIPFGVFFILIAVVYFRLRKWWKEITRLLLEKEEEFKVQHALILSEFNYEKQVVQDAYSKKILALGNEIGELKKLNLTLRDSLASNSTDGPTRGLKKDDVVSLLTSLSNPTSSYEIGVYNGVVALSKVIVPDIKVTPIDPKSISGQMYKRDGARFVRV
jgi:hypothetical protein